ncbi:MAG: hypothetical protein IIZ68_01485 [Clostridia bacterium]|nr:hypothetical protein [Clostridia bacterium]
MKYHIEEKSLEEFRRELNQYTSIRKEFNASTLSEEERRGELQRFSDRVMENSIALLYYGYCYDCLDDFLGCRDPHKPQIRGIRVDFGNREQRIYAMLSLCRTLEKYDRHTISSQPTLMNLYRDLADAIQYSSSPDGAVLYDEGFWRLYFAFYNAYKEVSRNP